MKLGLKSGFGVLIWTCYGNLFDLGFIFKKQLVGTCNQDEDLGFMIKNQGLYGILIDLEFMIRIKIC